MKTSSLKSKLLPAAALLAALLAMQWEWAPQSAEASIRQQNEKVNLAMRQAVHLLLASAGDSTSAIPPVTRQVENEFSLRLPDNFEYKKLPEFLQAAFQSYGIHEEYSVAVKSCEDDNLLLLGYSKKFYTENASVPCQERAAQSGCSLLSVTFPAKGIPHTLQSSLLLAGVLLLTVYIAFQIWMFFKNKTAGVEVTSPAATAGSAELFHFGNTAFDVTNQLVIIGNKRQTLTFREAKLLTVFCKNVNQLLERPLLLEEVWGDEGVRVGRSLDVFVSRLRKNLKSDEMVSIVNVHSVGYRLEVSK